MGQGKQYIRTDRERERERERERAKNQNIRYRLWKWLAFCLPAMGMPHPIRKWIASPQNRIGMLISTPQSLQNTVKHHFLYRDKQGSGLFFLG
jgi:homospermidine synthase